MAAQPWDQLPGENSTWYGRFLDYLQAKRPRSFLALYNADRDKKGQKKRTSPGGSWRKAFEEYRWQERCDAFDLAAQALLKEEYAARIDFQRQRELKASDLLYNKAELLLELSHVKETMDIDGQGITVLPDYKAFDTAQRLLAESKTQARAALEMVEKRSAISLDNEIAELLAALAGERQDHPQGSTEG